MQSSHCLPPSPHLPSFPAAASRYLPSVSLFLPPRFVTSQAGRFVLPGHLLSHIPSLRCPQSTRLKQSLVPRLSFCFTPLVETRQAAACSQPSRMSSLRRHPPSPSVNPFRSPTAANNPVTACFGFRLLSHIRITAFVSLSACLCYGRQAGTRRMQLLLVKVAAASKMASQEPPSSGSCSYPPAALPTRIPYYKASKSQRCSHATVFTLRQASTVLSAAKSRPTYSTTSHRAVFQAKTSQFYK